MCCSLQEAFVLRVLTSRAHRVLAPGMRTGCPRLRPEPRFHPQACSGLLCTAQTSLAGHRLAMCPARNGLLSSLWWFPLWSWHIHQDTHGLQKLVWAGHVTVGGPGKWVSMREGPQGGSSSTEQGRDVGQTGPTLAFKAPAQLLAPPFHT